MPDQMISYAFLVFELACGVVIILRFRGSLGALLGGIAFGVWVTIRLTQKILGALNIDWWDYHFMFTLLNLAAYGCLLAAFITGRTANGGEVKSQPAETSVPAEDPQLVGIGGWLILPAIGLILGPVMAAGSIISSLTLFSDVADTGHGDLFTLEILVQLGLLIFLIYTAVRFFGRRRNAPSVIIALLIVTVAVSAILLVVELAVGAESFAVESGKALLRGIVGAAIWIPFFKVSKRVKATFVH